MKFVCDCARLAHKKCVGSEIPCNESRQCKWICPFCLANEFPFNHSLDDKDFKDSLFEFFQCDKDVNLTRRNNLVLDIFSLNRDDDEEECEFDQFNVPSKYLKIEDLLQSIDHKFDVYAFSETWFEENVPSLFSISDYRFLHKSRKNRRGGGVCLYLQPDLQFKERPDLQFSNDSTDTLFVELENQSGKNIIVGVIYKAPNSNSDVFIADLLDSLQKITTENKHCYLTGDFNFDLLKHSNHGDTSKFFNTLLSHSFKPLITKPTRVTAHSCTCIDNIFSNVISSSIQSGILYSDVSDHFPIFQITTFKQNYRTVNKKHECFKTRVDMPSVIEELKKTDFGSILSNLSVNHAYNNLIEILQDSCKKYTVSKRITKKKWCSKKSWITAGILRSTNRKQRLYKKYLCSKSRKDRLRYNKYRNKLSSIIHRSRKMYYDNILQKSCSNLKKDMVYCQRTDRQEKISNSPHSHYHKSRQNL